MNCVLDEWGVAVILDGHGFLFNKKDRAIKEIYSGYLKTEIPAGYKGSEKMDLRVTPLLDRHIKFKEVVESKSSIRLLYLSVFVS